MFLKPLAKKNPSEKLYKRLILAPILVQCTDSTKVLLVYSKHKCTMYNVCEVAHIKTTEPTRPMPKPDMID